VVLATAFSPRASAATSSRAFRVQRLCGIPRAGSAACMAERLIPASLTPADLGANASRQALAAGGARPAVEVKSPEPGYLTPALLHAAYSLPTETASASSQTVAVVDAFDDPSAEADLGVYDKQFGLPACTSANGCFRKVNEEGNASPLPPVEGEWAAEISIDVQMAHSICQNCHVLLVEASSEEFGDLGAGVNAAAKLGATEISNSYGAIEEPSYTSLNSSFYDHPEVVVTVSSGDCGYFNKTCRGDPHGANFPADSPDVVAVGGTSLTENEGVWTSTVWNEGGSGCSSVFSAPLWQEELANFSLTQCGSERSVADVAAIGDPNTGIDVYDSTPEGTGAPTGWTVYGGTSVASPIIAAEFGLAGGSHGVPYAASTLYPHIGESDALYDIVSGSNGVCKGATSCAAAVGYDGPTGVGSPLGLAAFAQPGTPVDKTPPSISGTAQQGEQLTENHGEWDNGPTSYSYKWEDCNAAGVSCVAIEGAAGPSYTLTGSDVGSTIRVQEIGINEHGPGAPAVSAATQTVASDLPTIASFTPGSGITGSKVTINGTALSGASQVKIGKLQASYAVVSGTEIEATVPDGAIAGKISVTTALGSATSAAKFEPTLSVTRVSPTSGRVGKLVKIKGIGFNSSSEVSFDGTPATSVTFVSSKALKAVVPAGAGSGAITVTNSSAPLGSVSSAGVFTVT
jgi:hypothetical protein